MDYNKNDYKRCIICDYCASTADVSTDRKFTWDNHDHGWHCHKCVAAIVDTIAATQEEGQSLAYWKEGPRSVTDGDGSSWDLGYLEDAEGPVDPLQARLNTYPEVDDGS